MKKLSILFIFCILQYSTEAQSSRAIGQGNALGGEREEHSIFFNPAGMPYNEGHFALADYRNEYFLRELDHKSVGIHLALNSKSISATISQTGDERLSESRYRAGYGQRFGEAISMGLAINIIDRNFGDVYPGKTYFFSEFGTMCRLSRIYLLSFHVINPEQQYAGQHALDRIGSSMNLNLEGHFSDRFRMIAEVERSTSMPVNLKLAWVYSPMERLSVRSGLEIGTRRFGMGISVRLAHLLLDLNLAYHLELGIQSGISLSTPLKHKK